ncbi:hypothetical protein TWF730_009666 [Orbilia blumenaviensis]|uniref:ubiquitinyl hydrolase 1 n=1 Tax=Orbilia blumenaviensis TaxID=1796055 RepID=A0AAV9UVX9_9PEZI
MRSPRKGKRSSPDLEETGGRKRRKLAKPEAEDGETSPRNADPWISGGKRQVIAGIENRTHPNLCYVNTALQSLAGTSYPRWVEQAKGADYSDNPGAAGLVNRVDAVLKELNRFGTAASKPSVTVGTPTPEALTFPEYGMDQQCATELIMRLNDRLVSNLGAGDTQNPLRIEVLVRRNCLDCGNVWTQPEEHQSLQLNKPAKKGGTLAESLEFYQRVSEWRTGGCNRCRGLAIRRILRRALRNASRDKTSGGAVEALRGRLCFLEQALKDGRINNLTEDEERRIGLARKGRAPVRPTKTDEMTAEEHKNLLDAYHDKVEKRRIDYDSTWAQTQTVTSLPDIILLEFANVSQIDARGRAGKLKTKIKYDPVVDFSEYVAGPSRNLDAGDFDAPIRINDDPTNPALRPYELRSILIHSGPSFTAGHWYCYRREWDDPDGPLGEQWWYCNEGNTVRVSKQEMFKKGREEAKARGGDMYALIYQKVPEGGTVPGDGGDEGRKTNWKEANY